jgi:hypothetical protein
MVGPPVNTGLPGLCPIMAVHRIDQGLSFRSLDKGKMDILTRQLRPVDHRLVMADIHPMDHKVHPPLGEFIPAGQAGKAIQEQKEQRSHQDLLD